MQIFFIPKKVFFFFFVVTNLKLKKTHYKHHCNHPCHHNHHHHHHHHHHNHHCHSLSSPLWCQLCLRSFGSKKSHFPFSRLVTFQHKIDFQSQKVAFLSKEKTGNHVRYFLRLAHFFCYCALIRSDRISIHQGYPDKDLHLLILSPHVENQI